ncbi:cell wall-active antibiotics response protein LiaF [Alkaliphilus transvaalensis]|uniref:cell wall-active antibiotics response protein LiaF n=1 Tax=Alkaliphilus transvaalensis TaxID=114628 RepID=UPI0004797E4A|nr:cell wall-active antibiotics response protein LiaF [Alkaliphilus transvaalensis]
MKRFLFGVLLISVGILFLLSNMQLIPYNMGDLIYNYWPALLIFWGIHEFYDEFSIYKRRPSISDLFFPTLLTTLGLVLLGNRLNWFPNGSISIWNAFIPVVIIFVGLSFIFPSKRKKVVTFHSDGKHKEKVKFKDKHIHFFSSQDNDTRNVLFGSFEIGNEPWVLEDSSYHVGVGEAKINLSKAYIKEGETHLDVSGCTGSIVIIIPADIAVNIDAHLDLGSVVIFNEEHSGTPGRVNYRSLNYDEAYKKLDINVKLNIGEILIKQVY